MRVPTTIAAVAAACALTFGGVGLAAAGVPAASAVTVVATDVNPSDDRVQAITDALADLVSAGTLTQQQAETVATTLAESAALHGRGHGGRLLDLDAAATALGMTQDDLRTALEADGATLTTVAAAQGVEVSVLTDALTAAATERIEQRVTDGNLTREAADEKLAELPNRITALLTQDISHQPGPRGHRQGN